MSIRVTVDVDIDRRVESCTRGYFPLGNLNYTQETFPLSTPIKVVNSNILDEFYIVLKAGYRVVAIKPTHYSQKAISAKISPDNTAYFSFTPSVIEQGDDCHISIYTEEIPKTPAPTPEPKPEPEKNNFYTFSFEGDGFSVTSTGNITRVSDHVFHVPRPNGDGNFKIAPDVGCRLNEPVVVSPTIYTTQFGMLASVQGYPIFEGDSDGYVGVDQFFNDNIDGFDKGQLNKTATIKVDVIRTSTPPKEPDKPSNPDTPKPNQPSQPSGVDAAPYMGLYSLDRKGLIKLGNTPMIRYKTMASGDSQQIVETENSTMYMLNMMQFDFKLPDRYINGRSTVNIGSTRTDVEADVVASDTIVFDVGVIDVPVGENSIQYKAGKYEIILPSVDDVIDLPVYEVLGHKIRVEYCLNVTTGDLTINLYNELNVSPFMSKTTSIGYSVPVKLNELEQVAAGSQKNAKTGVMVPYIRVTTPVLAEGDSMNLISKHGVIGGYKGYCVVDDIKIPSLPTKYERDTLSSVLTGGFYIA